MKRTLLSISFYIFILAGTRILQAQTPANVCVAGSAITSMLANTGQICAPMAAIIDTNDYLGNTGAISSITECSTTVCPAGEYLVIVSLTPTATATLGTISLQVGFTDTGQAQTVTAISALALTTKAPATAVYPLWSTGAQPIKWSTTVAGITGTYSYDVHVRIFKM